MKRCSPIHRSRPLLSLLLVLLIIFPYTAAAASLQGIVTWVYDGDTLKIAGIGKVRLLGIDSPEREAGRRDRNFRKLGAKADLRAIHDQALRFNIQAVKGRQVVLKCDQGDQRDRYGRLLAYVYLPDGRLLNQLLLENGLAIVYRRFDFTLKPAFLEAEQTAQAHDVGMWSK